MLERLTIQDRLEMFAEAGETSAPLKLWKPTISKLERGGFLVEIIAPSQREGEYYCNIDWKNPRGSAARDMLRLSIQALESNS